MSDLIGVAVPHEGVLTTIGLCASDVPFVLVVLQSPGDCEGVQIIGGTVCDQGCGAAGGFRDAKLWVDA